jgi:hypothetical protein
VLWIDSVLLRLAEWACHRFQRMTGRTNVWLAVQLTNLSIVGYFVWVAVSAWHTDVASQVLIALGCAGLLYTLTQTLFRVSIETYENSAYLRVARGLRNPRQLRDQPLRVAFVTLCLFLLFPIAFVYVNLRLNFFLLGYFLTVLVTVVMYLLACDPLPPCVGWLREWLRRALPSRAAAADVSPP